MPADHLVSFEQGPTVVGREPIARVADLGRRAVDVVIRKITQVTVGGVATRIQDGHCRGPVIPQLPPAGFHPGGPGQAAAVRQGRHTIPVQHETTKRAVGEKSSQAGLIQIQDGNSTEPVQRVENPALART